MSPPSALFWRARVVHFWSRNLQLRAGGTTLWKSLPRLRSFERLSGDIHRRLSAGSPDALNGPTACSEWDVGTVAAHLAGGAMRQRDAMLAARKGTVARPLARKRWRPQTRCNNPTRSTTFRPATIGATRCWTISGRVTATSIPCSVVGRIGQSDAGTDAGEQYPLKATLTCASRSW